MLKKVFGQASNQNKISCKKKEPPSNDGT